MFMINNINKDFLSKYITPIIIACIAPMGYFAPIGEWLLIAFLALLTLIHFIFNSHKVNLSSLTVLFLVCLFMSCSFLWSINQDRTAEVIWPTIGIMFAIYIIISFTSRINTKNIDLILGFSLLATSIVIMSDLLLDTGIRTNLALMVGDNPTSKSGNYSRGILILLILMPILVASLINSKRVILALIIFFLVSSIVIIGPNDTAKLALFASVIAAIIIYFFGPKSFFSFGIIVILWILFAPLLVQKLFPSLTHMERNITITCVCDVPETAEYCTKNSNNKCTKIVPWQASSVGGSIAHRLLVWEFVGKEINKSLLLGNGLGTSRLIGQNIVLNVPRTKKDIHGAIPLHPHNSVLEIWLELGLIGAILYSSLWVLILKLGVSLRKKSFIMGTGACVTIINIFIISSLSFGIFQSWWMSSIGLIFFIIIQTSNNYLKLK